MTYFAPLVRQDGIEVAFEAGKDAITFSKKVSQ